ncbi:hypothetical protein EVAR_57127_1 [Eumeta japonica]|uniref:Uncharacterized protein n=1 Tax=Eumeta variegata TaxID=151549 RepID=A0A4C1YP86_EUMVA|nr:hypothetical protein EVAR_57127_1 [Eumeta japonica]
MASQGIEMANDEEAPVDRHAEREAWAKIKPPPRGERGVANKLRQFLEYEGKNLAFEPSKSSIASVEVYDTSDSSVDILGIQVRPNSSNASLQPEQFDMHAEYSRHWDLTTKRLSNVFMNNKFSHKCDIYDQWWFSKE